ncbi:MAG: hypothetical protein ACI4OO_06360 [Otoolea sp.]|nr:hypothetical protein [Clostridium sp.]MDY5483287.1 hypothetical protein [Clostridium sp.]
MSEYHVSRIKETDAREQKKLAATGSCYGNTLRCMAVDSSHQGEGLLNQVSSHLIQYEYEQGIIDLF